MKIFASKVFFCFFVEIIRLIDFFYDRTDQLKSLFTLIIHIQTENMNRTTGYQDIPKNDIKPIDCKTTVGIGREIANITNLIPINDIRSVEVDLIHQWYDHSTCLAERTRIKLYL